MKLVFLKASIPLTKTFTKTPQGIEKSSYPNVYEVTSIEEECASLKDMAKLISNHAADGHAVTVLANVQDGAAARASCARRRAALRFACMAIRCATP